MFRVGEYVEAEGHIRGTGKIVERAVYAVKALKKKQADGTIVDRGGTIAPGEERMLQVTPVISGGNTHVVPEKICTVYSMKTTARNRRGGTSRLPSLLSPEHKSMATLRAKVRPPLRPKKPANQKERIAQLLALAKVNKEKAIARMTREMKKGAATKGWLRKDRGPGSAAPGGAKKQLDAEDKKNFILMSFYLGSTEVAMGLIAHAWDINRTTIGRNIKQFEEHGTIERKGRRDNGSTVFTCPIKQRQCFTPRSAFSKKMRTLNPGQRLSKKELAEAYASASAEEKEAAEAQANLWLLRGPSLKDDLDKIMKRYENSGYTISWERIANELAGHGCVQIVSAEAIRKFVATAKEKK
mmetsp:Transcript_4878/g.12845  ORF Transcript_4878/g.12845 Transcript_4878/m.12845 type:complete len:355 (+) Transcript_4878:164-1228(+)